MSRRRPRANLIECPPDAIYDFARLVSSAGRRSQIQHELKRVFDAAMRKRIEADADRLEPPLQHILSAVRDYQIRFEFDDLFDVWIEQSTDPRPIAKLRRNPIVIPDRNHPPGQPEREECFCGARHNRNDLLRN